MPSLRIIFLLGLFACQEQKENDTEEQEDCPAMVLPCPEGQVPCNVETDAAPCAEVVLGEEPCTQIRDCSPE